MQPVGFKKAEIGIFDDTFTTTEVLTIEGKTNKGATRTFSVEGLSAEAVKQYGSNVAYRTAAKGVGDVQATLAAIDVPVEVDAKLLGLTIDTEGIYEGGEDTEPPYTAAIFYDETPQGEPMAIALYRGMWSKSSIEGETKEDGNKELAEEEYNMSCVANDEGKSYAIAVGDKAVTALRARAFPGLTVTPQG